MKIRFRIHLLLEAQSKWRHFRPVGLTVIAAFVTVRVRSQLNEMQVTLACYSEFYFLIFLLLHSLCIKLQYLQTTERKKKP